jgi:hypothetical protein
MAYSKKHVQDKRKSRWERDHRRMEAEPMVLPGGGKIAGCYAGVQYAIGANGLVLARRPGEAWSGYWGTTVAHVARLTGYKANESTDR